MIYVIITNFQGSMFLCSQGIVKIQFVNVFELVQVLDEIASQKYIHIKLSRHVGHQKKGYQIEQHLIFFQMLFYQCKSYIYLKMFNDYLESKFMWNCVCCQDIVKIYFVNVFELVQVLDVARTNIYIQNYLNMQDIQKFKRYQIEQHLIFFQMLFYQCNRIYIFKDGYRYFVQKVYLCKIVYTYILRIYIYFWVYEFHFSKTLGGGFFQLKRILRIRIYFGKTKQLVKNIYIQSYLDMQDIKKKDTRQNSTQFSYQNFKVYMYSLIFQVEYIFEQLDILG
eukprot:TRINITY_DN15128_c1_g1_i8.p1 TRINITY_DN15128_c1_g1~~TRINITY_DN15128_c1_g1_i8.p1  ORF type:complete len:280 (+),score=-15.84 TRINITY_DN15128_c1_g1_i8:772-1611(+)